MARIVWSENAVNDLDAIVAYIGTDSQRNAAIFGRALFDAPNRLKIFPESGQPIPEAPYAGIRQVLHGAYRILYVFEDDVCTILAIRHSARDISSFIDVIRSKLGNPPDFQE